MKMNWVYPSKLPAHIQSAEFFQRERVDSFIFFCNQLIGKVSDNFDARVVLIHYVVQNYLMT